MDVFKLEFELEFNRTTQLSLEESIIHVYKNVSYVQYGQTLIMYGYHGNRNNSF